MLNVDIVEINTLLQRESARDKTFTFIDVFSRFFDSVQFKELEHMFLPDRLVRSYYTILNLLYYIMNIDPFFLQMFIGS